VTRNIVHKDSPRGLRGVSHPLAVIPDRQRKPPAIWGDNGRIHAVNLKTPAGRAAEKTGQAAAGTVKTMAIQN
jgi:hypothetical protein